MSFNKVINNKKLIVKYIIYLFLIGFISFLIYNVYIYNTHYYHNPIADKGSISLSADRLDSYHGVKLNGQWLIYYNEFRSYEELINPSENENLSYINLPGEWADIPDNDMIKETGYATFMLRCKTDFKGKLTLRLGEVMSAYELRIFSSKTGEELMLSCDGDCRKTIIDNKSIKSGEIGTNQESTLPKNIYKNVIFDVDGDFDIVLYISNYRFRSGGILIPVYIGTERVINDFNMLNKKLDFINASSLIIIMLILIFIFFLYESKYNNKSHSLVLILFILLVLIKLSMIGSQIIYDIFPDFIWEAELKIEYASNSAIFLIYLFLFYFHEEIGGRRSKYESIILNRHLKNVNLILVITMLVIIAFIPLKFLSHVKYIFLFLIIYGIILSILLFVSLIKKFNNEAIKHFIGIGIISFTITNIIDVFYYNLHWDFFFGMEIGNLGNMLYVLFSMIILIHYYIINRNIELENTNTNLGNIFNDISVSILITDENGFVKDINDKSDDIFVNIEKNIKDPAFYKSHGEMLSSLAVKSIQSTDICKTEQKIEYKADGFIYPSKWTFSPINNGDNTYTGNIVMIIKEGKKRKACDIKNEVECKLKEKIIGSSKPIKNIINTSSNYITGEGKYLSIIGDEGTGKKYIINTILDIFYQNFGYKKIVFPATDFIEKNGVSNKSTLSERINSANDSDYNFAVLVFENIDHLDRKHLSILHDYLHNPDSRFEELKHIKKVIFTITNINNLKYNDFTNSFITNKLTLPTLNEIKHIDLSELIDHIYSNNEDIKLLLKGRNRPKISDDAKKQLPQHDFDSNENFKKNYFGLIDIIKDAVKDALENNSNIIKKFNIDTDFVEAVTVEWIKEKNSYSKKNNFIKKLVKRLEDNKFITKAEHNSNTIQKVFTSDKTKYPSVYIKPIVWADNDHNKKTLLFLIYLLETFCLIESGNNRTFIKTFLNKDGNAFSDRGYRKEKSNFITSESKKFNIDIEEEPKNHVEIKTIYLSNSLVKTLFDGCKKLFDIVNELKEDFYGVDKSMVYDKKTGNKTTKYINWKCK